MSVTEQPIVSGDVRSVLDSMASSFTSSKNSVIFTQGDAPVGVYVIRKGSVRLTVKAGDSEILMRIAQPGSVLGLPGVLSNKPYSLTARATQNCELGFVTADKLIQVVRDNPTLGLQVLQLLSEEVRAARGAMANTRQIAKA
jgi:CRP/FNR family transcriptional regulator